MIDKAAIIKRLKEALASEIAEARRSANETRAASTHPEAKPENDKDTRALELSYLARGQAQRVMELEAAEERLARLSVRDFSAPGTPLALTALVRVETAEEKTLYYLLAPACGGLRLHESGIEVIVITPESPVGKSLLGRSAGDEITILAAGKRNESTIVEAW